MQIALPVVGVLVLTDLVLGVVGRFVPQMNLLLVGMPLKAAAGLLVLGLALPFLLVRMGDVLTAAPASDHRRPCANGPRWRAELRAQSGAGPRTADVSCKDVRFCTPLQPGLQARPRSVPAGSGALRKNP